MEYLNYKPGQQVDWTKAIGGLIDTVQGIDQAKKKEAADVANQATIGMKKLDDTSDYGTPSLQELILNGANTGRDYINYWNKLYKSGKINAVDFKNRNNNLIDNWTQIANSAKTYDQRMQDVLKRQQPNEKGIPDGSAFEAYMGKKYAEFGDLKNSSIEFDDNGNAFMVKIDPNTGKIKDRISAKEINNPGNIVDNTVKLNDIVEEYMKNFPDWKKEVGMKTTTDPRQNPFVAKAMASLGKAVASNSRSKASVLTNNTDKKYTFYSDADEFNSTMNEFISVEEEARRISKGDEYTPMTDDEKEKFVREHANLLIKVEKDENGIMQPVLTSQQEKDVMDTIYNNMEAYMKREIELDEPHYDSGGGRGRSGGSSKDNSALLAGYKATLRAWGYDANDVINKIDRPDTEWNVLSNGPDYGGLSKNYVYTRSYDKDKKRYKIEVTDKEGNLIHTAYKPKDLAQFVYNGSASEASIDWEDARKQVKEGSTREQDKEKSIEKAVNQVDFNKKWATLKPGQQLVGPDGKTYTKG